jgi:hypothetical protein
MELEAAASSNRSAVAEHWKLGLFSSPAKHKLRTFASSFPPDLTLSTAPTRRMAVSK